MKNFECSAYQHFKLRDTVNVCSTSETFKKMLPSNRTLIDQLKNVFTKVDLEYRDNSRLLELLTHLVNQDSKSDVQVFFHDSSGMNRVFQVQKLSEDRLKERK